mgnify:CR=1 FL=1
MILGEKSGGKSYRINSYIVGCKCKHKGDNNMITVKELIVT